MPKTGFVYHTDYLGHDTRDHPENSNRLRAILEALNGSKLIEELVLIQPTNASLEQIGYVHQSQYIKEVETVSGTEGWLDGDTPVCRNSYKAALLAAGGLINATDAVLKGDVDNAFALVRPPGHHAEPNSGMGFCLFNNVAIAARYLQKEKGLERILIIDWDVHHGNGTQDAFYDDPSVLYISTHQSPLYPGTGAINEIGLGKGLGYTVNVPLLAGTGDMSYSYVMDEVITPISLEFNPDFVLVSAGFDCHHADPLAGMNVTSNVFGDFTEAIKSIAKKACGKLVLTLEGGYNLRALSSSVLCVFNSLLESGMEIEEPYLVPEDRLSDPVKSRVKEVKMAQREYWGI